MISSLKISFNFIAIALRHGCSPLNLLHIFRTPFYKNTSGGLLLDFGYTPKRIYQQKSYTVMLPTAENVNVKINLHKNKQLLHCSYKEPVTKLKNQSGVYSILLGAVENNFQLVIQKESYEIVSDL